MSATRGEADGQAGAFRIPFEDDENGMWLGKRSGIDDYDSRRVGL